MIRDCIFCGHEFRDWIGLELYLAARDSVSSSGAGSRLKILSEVYEKLYGSEPDLKEMEDKYGEKSKKR